MMVMMMVMENEALCPHIDNEKEKQRAIMRKKRVIQKEEGTGEPAGGGSGEGGGASNYGLCECAWCKLHLSPSR